MSFLPISGGGGLSCCSLPFAEYIPCSVSIGWDLWHPSVAHDLVAVLMFPSDLATSNSRTRPFPLHHAYWKRRAFPFTLIRHSVVPLDKGRFGLVLLVAPVNSTPPSLNRPECPNPLARYPLCFALFVYLFSSPPAPRNERQAALQ